MFSWHHPLLEVRPATAHGSGTFARASIPRDEILIIFGGYVMTRAEERDLLPELRDNGICITPELVMGVKLVSEIETATYVNHSCTPNAGIKGQIFLVAMREIATGEEILFDYAMCLHRSTSAPPYSFACGCGSDVCRKLVTDEDWRRPDLQERYRGYFSYYLEEAIRSSKARDADERLS